MSGSNDDTLGGCGCLVIIVIAAAIHFQVDIGSIFSNFGNIFKALLVLGVVGLALMFFAIATDPAPPAKSKTKSKYHKAKKHKEKLKAREGVVVSPPYSPPASVQRERNTSRLEVPGGYVPFEMTRTETKTRDSVKTETKVKTYVDSREVKAILQGEDVDVLTDGRRGSSRR